jgi:hypothetical protein
LAAAQRASLKDLIALSLPFFRQRKSVHRNGVELLDNDMRKWFSARGYTNSNSIGKIEFSEGFRDGDVSGAFSFAF